MSSPGGEVIPGLVMSKDNEVCRIISYLTEYYAFTPSSKRDAKQQVWRFVPASVVCSRWFGKVQTLGNTTNFTACPRSGWVVLHHLLMWSNSGVLINLCVSFGAWPELFKAHALSTKEALAASMTDAAANTGNVRDCGGFSCYLPWVLERNNGHSCLFTALAFFLFFYIVTDQDACGPLCCIFVTEVAFL